MLFCFAAPAEPDAAKGPHSNVEMGACWSYPRTQGRQKPGESIPDVIRPHRRPRRRGSWHGVFVRVAPDIEERRRQILKTAAESRCLGPGSDGLSSFHMKEEKS